MFPIIPLNLQRWLWISAIVAAPFAPTLFATEETSISINSDAPTGEMLSTFGNGEGTNGWSWYRLADGASSRNIGISFKVSADAELRKITLFIRSVAKKGNQSFPFHLQLFQTESLSQPPEVGRLLTSEKGEMIIDPTDAGMYLTFNLGTPVSVEPGCFYLFTLSWDQKVSSCNILFAIDENYSEGRCWYTDSASPETFRILNDSTKPGLVFFIQ